MSKHPANDARPYTETSALQDILQWSKTRPDWLRDALRRLMVASELSDLDIDELEALCLGTGGDASPLSEEHIAPQRLAGKPVAITGLRDPVAVNALARSACRSRDDKTSILPDVTAADDVPQSARIEFQVAGNADTYEWRPEHGDHADLSAVSIFDSRSANTHVQKTNNVAYVPFPMALLDRLGRVCDELRRRVAARIDALSARAPVAIKTPSLNEATAAGAFLHGLSAK